MLSCTTSGKWNRPILPTFGPT